LIDWSIRRVLFEKITIICLNLVRPPQLKYYNLAYRIVCLRQARVLDGGIVFSTCLFIHLSVCPFRNLWTVDFQNKLIDFDANWHKWSMWQRHETVDFEAQKVRSTRPK